MTRDEDELLAAALQREEDSHFAISLQMQERKRLGRVDCERKHLDGLELVLNLLSYLIPKKLYNMKIGVDEEDSEDFEEDSDCEFDYTEPDPKNAPVLIYDKYQRQEDKEISHTRYISTFLKRFHPLAYH